MVRVSNDWGWLALVVLFMLSARSWSQDIEAGKLAAQDERCAECHGVDGNIHTPNESSKIPKLAGQSPDYLLKQFQDFRSGDRQNDFMAMMANSLDDTDVEAIFAWYAKQPAMSGTGSTNALGKKLFLEGDNNRGIVACALCHGENGKGASALPEAYANLDAKFIPIIGGQDWHYLDQQLRDWRSGARTNSPDGVMNKVTAQLTDTEITALNDFIAGLK